MLIMCTVCACHTRRFFLSLEDTLFRVFGGDRIKNLMVAFRVEDLPMESQMLTDALDTAQKRVENYFFDIRKCVVGAGRPMQA